ncbi:hypothetical protein [Streptomyces sp. NPDC101455]|uniref:hypothetical protein n=1 Tax=Streptomyces sp. NPDC101455 TaxID=3366142 RepID=UPI003809E434
MDVELVRVVETCRPYSAMAGTLRQWEATDAEGFFLLLSFKSGMGTAHRLKDNDSWGQRTDDYDLVAEFDTGDAAECELSLEEFCRRAGIRLAESVVVVTLEQRQ